MDMLFTHFGLSGPAILRCSQFVVKERMKNGNQPVEIRIDSLPSMNEEKVFQTLHAILKEDSTKAIKNVLKGLTPERWLLCLFERAGIDPSETGAQMSRRNTYIFIRKQTVYRLVFAVNCCACIR